MYKEKEKLSQSKPLGIHVFITSKDMIDLPDC